MLELKHVKKSYDNVTILEDINLQIEDGEIVSILGPSGCGKTTLLNLVLGLTPADSGEIIFDGKDITNVPMEERGFNIVFQDYALFPNLNVYKNITYGLKNKPDISTKEEVDEFIDLLGLREHLDKKIEQLSGGQKQRVAIARALATNPKVLLCDEATSALDPNTTKSILQLLKQINKDLGVTVIVITHEMAVIEAICDRVAIIDKSHIAESGKVSEIFSEPKSKIGRQLILGDAVETGNFGGGRQIRIIFDGRASSEPVLANMILACKTPVNIMYAATRDINGTAMGQMIVQLPEDEADARRVTNYLSTAKVPYEEVNEDAV